MSGITYINLDKSTLKLVAYSDGFKKNILAFIFDFFIYDDEKYIYLIESHLT